MAVLAGIRFKIENTFALPQEKKAGPGGHAFLCVNLQ
jgi:hypothetical protein